jgi:hypothetical protein
MSVTHPPCAVNGNAGHCLDRYVTVYDDGSAASRPEPLVLGYRAAFGIAMTCVYILPWYYDYVQSRSFSKNFGFTPRKKLIPHDLLRAARICPV